MRAFLLLAATLSCGCSGAIGSPPTTSGGVVSPGAGGTGMGGTVGTSCPKGISAPGRAPLRRLNRVEYNNTIHDLLGETMPLADSFPPDDEGLGFTNNADAMVVTGLLAQSYIDAAETMATNALARLTTLSPCNVSQTGEDVCSRQFITTLGKRAFRRPLTNEEVTRYQGLFATGKQGGAYQDGIALVIQALLQSPYFLYRIEDTVPAPGQPVALLSPYEMASRMSYFLWGTMPDDVLFAAADGGMLGTRDQVAAQAQRMLMDPRARQMVSAFHREWLELNHALEAPKAPMLYPAWSAQLAADLYKESQTFVDQVFWTDGKVGTFLTAPYSYVNANIAQLYGVGVPAGPDAFNKVMLDPTQRAGLLTQGTFLASHAGPDQSSPVRRGKFVREQLLCQPVPPPPNNIVIKPPDYDPTSSTRERFGAHEKEALCAGCHAVMDPIGFGLEHYDAIGRYRTMDGPHPVDASGSLKGTDVDGTFDGAVQLVGRLAGSREIATCVTTQWFRYANGREESAEDGCALDNLHSGFEAAQRDMRTLPLAMVTSDTFRYRAAQGDAP